MTRTGACLVVLFAWLPVGALLVLVGIALGWWAAVLGAIPFVVFGALGFHRATRVRDRPPVDPAAIRAELAAIDRRSVPWIKAWTSCSLVMLALGVVIGLIAAFGSR